VNRWGTKKSHWEPAKRKPGNGTPVSPSQEPTKHKAYYLFDVQPRFRCPRRARSPTTPKSPTAPTGTGVVTVVLAAAAKRKAENMHTEPAANSTSNQAKGKGKLQPKTHRPAGGDNRQPQQTTGRRFVTGSTTVSIPDGLHCRADVWPSSTSSTPKGFQVEVSGGAYTSGAPSPVP